MDQELTKYDYIEAIDFLLGLADEQQQLIVLMLEDDIGGRKWNDQQKEEALNRARYARETIIKFRGRFEAKVSGVGDEL